MKVLGTSTTTRQDTKIIIKKIWNNPELTTPSTRGRCAVHATYSTRHVPFPLPISRNSASFLFNLAANRNSEVINHDIQIDGDRIETELVLLSGPVPTSQAMWFDDMSYR